MILASLVLAIKSPECVLTIKLFSRNSLIKKFDIFVEFSSDKNS